MIARVIRGKSAYGLVRYLYGEGRRCEHSDPHMIASWDGAPSALEPEWIEGLRRHDVGPLVSTLEQPVRVCERAPEQYVYHLVFRAAPDDRTLSDDEWAAMCVEAMDRTGIAPRDDPSACRWIAVRHDSDHVHLVATLAREDGRAPTLFRDFLQLREVAQDFEDRYGLQSTRKRHDRTAASRPGVQEQAASDRAGRAQAARVTLRERVKGAAGAATGFDDFTAILRRAGVTVWPRMSQENPGQVTGYSVSLDDYRTAAGEPVRFGGGKLAPDLSLPKLTARWTAPETGTHHPPRDPSAIDASAAEDVWREAERIVHEAADRIRTEGHTNPEAAADAAWAAGDTLSASALWLEGEDGGPLTDAAEAFDRAARMQYRRVPQRSDTGAMLRAASRMIVLLSAGSDHPAAQMAALTTALASLTVAVADLRRAQDRQHQAEAALRAADLLRPSTETAPQQPPQPRTAAQVAAQSFGTGGFRLRPEQGTRSGTRHEDNVAQKRRNDGRGRGV